MLALRRLAGLGAVCLAFAVSACGPSEPGPSGRTAAQWSALLWDPAPAKAGEAMAALREISRSSPAEVTDALVAQLVAKRPSATSTTFAVRLDLERARAEGGGAIDPADALRVDLIRLRDRLRTASIPVASLHADADGKVDVTLEGDVTPAEVERIQRLACRRGVLGLRVAGEETATSEETFDDRMVESARGFVDADGRARVAIVVAEPRRGALMRWTRARIGRELVVVRDGVATETRAIVGPLSDHITLVAVADPAQAGDAARVAREDAAVLAHGRMPWPLAPVPYVEGEGRDPAPSNPVSRTLVSVGEPALPALDRVAQSDAKPWSKRSAAWAAEQIRRAMEVRKADPR